MATAPGTFPLQQHYVARMPEARRSPLEAPAPSKGPVPRQKE